MCRATIRWHQTDYLQLYLYNSIQNAKQNVYVYSFFFLLWYHIGLCDTLPHLKKTLIKQRKLSKVVLLLKRVRILVSLSAKRQQYVCEIQVVVYTKVFDSCVCFDVVLRRSFFYRCNFFVLILYRHVIRQIFRSVCCALKSHIVIFKKVMESHTNSINEKKLNRIQCTFSPCKKFTNIKRSLTLLLLIYKNIICCMLQENGKHE